MKKLSLVLLVALMLSGVIGKAQNAPDVSGFWSLSNGAAIKISQNGGKVSWTLQDGCCNYSSEGKWKTEEGGYFSVVVERKSKSNSCITYLKVKMTPLTDTKMQFEESAMDQNCDVKLGYKNSFTMQKQD